MICNNENQLVNLAEKRRLDAKMGLLLLYSNVASANNKHAVSHLGRNKSKLNRIHTKNIIYQRMQGLLGNNSLVGSLPLDAPVSSPSLRGNVSQAKYRLPMQWQKLHV